MIDKEFYSTMDGQKAMCHNGFISATTGALQNMIDDLRKKRFALVKSWRDGGQTDALWAEVEALDIVLDRQEGAMVEVNSHTI